MAWLFYDCTECNENVPRNKYACADQAHRITQIPIVFAKDVSIRCAANAISMRAHSTACPNSKKRRPGGSAEGEYVCISCRYPPCRACKVTPRPRHKIQYAVENKALWICQDCVAKSCNTDSIACQCCGHAKSTKSCNQNDLRKFRRTVALHEAKYTASKDMLKC